jgi:hypothetical protein
MFVDTPLPQRIVICWPGSCLFSIVPQIAKSHLSIETIVRTP